jgi:energy-coupling factor transport system ATP-binding protein
MLDPVSRRELMDVIQKLHEDGRTIILITHHTDEAALADRLILMDRGHIAAQGTPAELFADSELLRSIRMDIPPVTELAMMLSDAGIVGDGGTVLTKGELIARVIEAGRNAASCTGHREGTAGEKEDYHTSYKTPAGRPVLEVRDLHYTYQKGEINETPVLKGVSFTLHEGECIGLIGTSGAGKTTLAKNLNGLLKAESGDVLYRGESIYRNGYKLSGLRKEVGLVFQNPETQLFCKTVLDDVMFGPRKMGMTDEEALAAAKEALATVDIDEEYHDISPMDLSGGQKRRVALAGVLAMKPSVLILDEPAAGLDPGMKTEIFNIIEKTRRENGTAVILVSHEMEDIVRYCDRVMLMADGTIKLEGTPDEVFSQVEKVREFGADVPAVTDLMYELRKAGFALGRLAVTTADAAEAIASVITGEGGGR